MISKVPSNVVIIKRLNPCSPVCPFSSTHSTAFPHAAHAQRTRPPALKPPYPILNFFLLPANFHTSSDALGARAATPCVTDRRLCFRSARTAHALPGRACAVGPKMASEAGGLQEEALRRRERLKALRERTGAARKQNEEREALQAKVLKSGRREEEEEKEEGVPKHKELKLRNYIPEDVELQERVVANAKPASVEDKVKEQLEAAKPELIIEEVDLANLAPRKPDWDLKRDVAKKLEKLEKRTQRAIAELIRERLRGQEEELASAVDSAKQEDSDSD